VTESAHEAAARRFARLCIALPEFEMKVALAREEVLGIPDDDGVEVLAIVCREAEQRDVGYQEALLAIVSAIADEPERCEARYAERARSRGHDAVLRLVRPRGTARVDDAKERIPDYGKGRPLTLGERKTLARTARRDLIQRVIADPSPDVIAQLLVNPKLTEQDVIQLVARRPGHPEVLRLVARMNAWSSRYRVRVAIVFNPWTPVEVSVSLAESLLWQDLRRAVEFGELPAAVREACADIARRKPPHEWHAEVEVEVEEE